MSIENETRNLKKSRRIFTPTNCIAENFSNTKYVPVLSSPSAMNSQGIRPRSKVVYRNRPKNESITKHTNFINSPTEKKKVVRLLTNYDNKKVKGHKKRSKISQNLSPAQKDHSLTLKSAQREAPSKKLVGQIISPKPRINYWTTSANYWKKLDSRRSKKMKKPKLRTQKLSSEIEEIVKGKDLNIALQGQNCKRFNFTTSIFPKSYRTPSET
ncbi:unnamed protein product [Moneuplotes crassus]|uniref:Uncharacterized protein n=1 Tax=Euplotes crassus TaxID=5936 RepID=A0AAD1Y760_EUPCR|nr:unnamed protein product [Moneuplotes crassus]